MDDNELIPLKGYLIRTSSQELRDKQAFCLHQPRCVRIWLTLASLHIIVLKNFNGRQNGPEDEFKEYNFVQSTSVPQ